MRAARVDSDGTRRALILAILADMIGQCLFQNYLNAIYQSTSLILVLATSIEMIGEEQALSARPLTMRRSGCRIDRAMAEVQAVSAQR